MASASVESVKRTSISFLMPLVVKAQQISLLLQIAHQSQYEMDKGYRKGRDLHVRTQERRLYYRYDIFSHLFSKTNRNG